MEKPKKKYPIAALSVRGLPVMNQRTARRLAEWLDKQREDMFLHPEKFSERFTARLW